MKKPRLRVLGHVSGFVVYLVSGEQVRNTIDIDFTQGGNEGAYPKYVPAGEIWIDDAMHALDRIATTFHEIAERDLMVDRGWGYDEAHEAACEMEKLFRARLMKRKPTAFDAGLIERELAMISEGARA